MNRRIRKLCLMVLLAAVGLSTSSCTFSKNDDKKGSIYKSADHPNQDNGAQTNR